MLVLTRKSGETLLIGDQIEISIVEVQGDKVKIGITAPRDIRILRKELVEELKSTNTQAAAAEISLGRLAEALGAEKRPGGQMKEN